MRYAVPASLWHRPKPSVAWAFGGVIPALRYPCFAWVPARAILARAFAGTTVHRTVVFLRLAHRTFTLLSPHPPDLYRVPLRPWIFQLEKQKVRFLLLHPRRRKRYVRVPLLSIFQMLNAFAKWQQVPVPPSRVLFQHPARHQTICRVTNPGSLG